MRLPFYFVSAVVLELISTMKVLSGRIKALNVAKVVQFLPGSLIRGKDPLDNLYIALLVRGKDDELIDALGCAWDLPFSINDTPQRSEIWAENYLDVLKSIVVNSKPRHAIRDATLMMETTLPMLLADSDGLDFPLGGQFPPNLGILSTLVASQCSELY